MIKVVVANTDELVKKAIEAATLNPQYAEVWIILDRDKVVGFDDIIKQAKENDIKVGWSNPCIEIWFNAYFGEMPTYDDSVKCCKNFEKAYKKRVEKEYKKADNQIYLKLCNFGDEEKAIEIAESRYTEYMKNGNDIPSKMYSATTVHLLVKEIKSKKGK